MYITRAVIQAVRLTSTLTKQSLAVASIILIGANLVGRGCGFLREAVVAGLFGTSALFDTFLLAFTVPELLTFVIFAALPTAIVPSIAGSGGEGNRAESRFFWKGLGTFGAVFALFSAVIYLLRSEILLLLAPDLEVVQRVLGIHLLAILSLFVFFRGMEAYFRGWLLQKKHFVTPALSPFVLNLVVVIVVFMLHGRLDIVSLAYGWLAGSVSLFIFNGLLTFVVVKPGLPDVARSISLRPLLKLTAIVMLVESLTLLYPAVDRYLAVKYLSEGQIAALRYATILSQLAPGILIVTFALASYPYIADLIASGDMRRLITLYKESLRSIVFVMVPIAAAMVWFAEEIVRVAFQRGAFDESSLMLTAGPFRYYALGILFYSIYHFQTRFYYARRAASRLGLILVLVLAVKVILSSLLVVPFEQNGLALATSFAWTLGVIAMTVDLRCKADLTVSGLFRPAAKMIVALGVTLCYYVGIGRLWPFAEGDPLIVTFIQLATIVLTGLCVYVVVAVLLKLPEPWKLWEVAASRLRKPQQN